MDNDLVISLAVTGIGMLILFVALAFLYGLIFLMTAFIKDRPKAETKEHRSREATEQTAMRRRAAVIAVALARAGHELSTNGAPSVQETISAWQVLHHQRQLMLNVPKRRVR